MAKFVVSWRIDFIGIDEIREIEVEAEDEESALQIALDILHSNLEILDVKVILDESKGGKNNGKPKTIL